MTKFSDQLFTDLMREHSATLQATRLPAAARGHTAVKRGAWLAGGAGTLAVGITAALAASSGGASAYAVTPHADGTVTVGISKPSGIAGANTRLTALGDRVVVVPGKAGCEPIDSLPAPTNQPKDKSDVRVSGSKSANGSITVDAHGIPQGDLLVLAAEDTGHGIFIAARVTSGPAPSCVSVPPPGVPGDKRKGTRPDGGTRPGGEPGKVSITGGGVPGPQGTKGGPGQPGTKQVITSSNGPGMNTIAG
jgi:hypothetical protein